MDDATRRLICYFAALDNQKPLPEVDIDCDTLLQEMDKHGLLNIAYWFQDQLPTACHQQLAEQHQLNQFYARLMQRRIATVLAALNAAGIDYMLVKGPALAYVIYPNPLLRPYKDIDIIVREKDWTRTHHQLIDMGYDPIGVSDAPPPKLFPLQVNYESEYRHPETRLLIEVHYDDILNAGLRSRDVDGFWQRSQICEIVGEPVRVMAKSDQLLHLCAHGHHHAYSEIKWMTDIGLMVRDHSGDLDWNQFIQTTQAEEAQVSVHYSLTILGKLLDIHAPAHVLEAVRPDKFRRFWHEHYMPTQQIISLQPVKAPLFVYYFTPLLTRLLPDLLVMGRRSEKIQYLPCLLLPPVDWLRFYYHLAPNEPAWLHYILHPAKLFLHYGVEIFNAIFRRNQSEP